MYPLIISALQMLGYWSHPSRAYNSVQAVGLIAMVLLWIVMPELVFIIRQEPSFGTIMKNMAEVLIVGISVPQSIISLEHREALEETYGEIQSTLDNISTDPHRDVQRVLKSSKKFSEWLFKGYMGGEIICATPYFLAIPILVTVKYLQTGIQPPLLGVFETDYFIFDYQSNVFLWLVTISVTIVFMIYLITFLVSSHCLYWSLMHNVSGLFKIVRMRIGRLDRFADDEKRHREELLEILRMHEVAYRGARSLEKTLNVFMLILYGMCIFNLCMVMIALTLPNNDHDLLMKMSVLVVYILFHIFVYSMLGTELMSTSEATAEAFYASHWYMRSVQEQRIILFAFARSQKMASLTTGKFFYVSRTTFGMALRSAMSYYAVLRQVYGIQ